MEMPIVTIVWRRSSPCMKRNTASCRNSPSAADARKPTATARSQDPVASPTSPAGVGAQQVERAVGEVDVAHQPEDQGEPAGNQEVQRGKRQAVQQRDQEEAGVVPERPDDERQDRHADDGGKDTIAQAQSPRTRALTRRLQQADRYAASADRRPSRGYRAGARQRIEVHQAAVRFQLAKLPLRADFTAGSL